MFFIANSKPPPHFWKVHSTSAPQLRNEKWKMKMCAICAFQELNPLLKPLGVLFFKPPPLGGLGTMASRRLPLALGDMRWIPTSASTINNYWIRLLQAMDIVKKFQPESLHLFTTKTTTPTRSHSPESSSIEVDSTHHYAVMMKVRLFMIAFKNYSRLGACMHTANHPEGDTPRDPHHYAVHTASIDFPRQ